MPWPGWCCATRGWDYTLPLTWDFDCWLAAQHPCGVPWQRLWGSSTACVRQMWHAASLTGAPWAWSHISKTWSSPRTIRLGDSSRCSPPTLSPCLLRLHRCPPPWGALALVQRTMVEVHSVIAAERFTGSGAGSSIGTRMARGLIRWLGSRSCTCRLITRQSSRLYSLVSTLVIHVLGFSLLWIQRFEAQRSFCLILDWWMRPSLSWRPGWGDGLSCNLTWALDGDERHKSSFYL